MRPRLTTFTNDGLTFEVVDDGPVDGEPIVLLHGFPQTASSWSMLSPYLHERGYRTIAPTQRGYSPGARPRGRLAYRMSKLVGDTTALIDAIGVGPVHLVGHDWGATVAWCTAVRYPAQVQTLTSLSVPHPMAFLRSMLRSNQLIRSWYMVAFQAPWLPELVLTQRDQMARGLASTGMHPARVEQVLHEVLDTGGMRGAVDWYRAMLLANPLVMRHKVLVPTTHVWSTRDGFLAREGADLAADYAAGPFRLEVLDASHWIADDRPAELAAIIAARVDGSAGAG